MQSLYFLLWTGLFLERSLLIFVLARMHSLYFQLQYWILSLGLLLDFKQSCVLFMHNLRCRTVRLFVLLCNVKHHLR